MTTAGITAMTAIVFSFLHTLRIHHCTSCGYRKPEEHLGNLEHARYLHTAFSESEQLLYFLALQVKHVVLPNDQQGGTFLPRCLQCVLFVYQENSYGH